MSSDEDEKPSAPGAETFDVLLRDIARSEAREPPQKDDLLGATFGHYRVVAELGRGGMGIVYRAEDSRLARDVALKVLPKSFAGDEERRRRFLREARSAAAINHPNIATIYEVGEVEGRLFLAMERVEGTTLRARLRAGPLGREEALRITRQLALGLARAHDRGIVHRDLKPENVMLAHDGDVKILDFGLAKLTERTLSDAPAAQSTLTQEGRVMGTPGYMSPEQATARSVDERTDVYSLGVVLHEMVTGELPGAHGSGRVAPDPAVAAIVMRCLARAPEDRWANGAAVVAALDALELAARRASPKVVRPSARTLRAWGLAVGGLSVAVVLGGALVWSAMRGPRASVPSLASSAPEGMRRQTGATCSSNRACVELHGGEAWRCHAESHTCVEIASVDCKVYAQPHDAEQDDVVWIGGMFPLSTDPGLVDEMRALELARQDFATTLGPSAARQGALHAGPIELVVCDEGVDPVRAAHHLADDVQVPAVIGFRSTSSALTTIPSVFLPKRVLSIVSISQAPELTQIPEPPREPRLVWRSTLNLDDAARPLAQLISDVLEPAARAGAHGIGQRPLKVAAVWARAGNHEVMDSLFGVLRFNGRSALDNGTNFRQLVYHTDADASDGDVVDALLAFAPQVIIVADQAFDSKVLVPLEARWAEGPRPFYVTAGGLSTEDAAFAGRDPMRRRRFFSVTNLSTTMTNARLVLRYNLAYPAEPVVRTEAPQPSYDAFYVLAYARYALGDGPVSGPALADAMQRLLPPGRSVDVGPAQILGAFETLRSAPDGRIDLNGALGSLDFDSATGEAPVDYAVICLGLDDHGAASAPVESGLVYDARARKLLGALRCP